MDYLDVLENESIHIIREAYHSFSKKAVLWYIGKDSTTLIWLLRKAFFGRIPFPVVHIDTGYKFKQIYEFRDRFAKEWGLDLHIIKNRKAVQSGVCPQKDRLECCTQLKTNALKKYIRDSQTEAVYLGIRRDEHGIRAKERVFSVRDEKFVWNYNEQPLELWGQYKSQINQEEHIRVHPILNWTELDIWKYIRREQIPISELYLSKDGKRYRSIGCEVCCTPVVSNAATVDMIIEEIKTTNISERSGRVQDKESNHMMQKLRALGYM